MNRGSKRTAALVGTSDKASMRPRFMNRGSSPVAGVGTRRATGFNEAPIHESGKCARERGARAGSRCFNEAPIHESGKS